MTPDRITLEERKDKNGSPYLETRYYDHDAQYTREAHLRRPELAVEFTRLEDVVRYLSLFRQPSFVIARKQDKFWKITEKVFAEEL